MLRRTALAEDSVMDGNQVDSSLSLSLEIHKGIDLWKRQCIPRYIVIATCRNT